MIWLLILFSHEEKQKKNILTMTMEIASFHMENEHVKLHVVIE